MSGWPWLLGAIAAASGAVLLGWPTWSSYQARRRRDRNAERYLVWRGRADRGPTQDALSPGERQRLWFAAGLAVAALACLAIFLGAR